MHNSCLILVVVLRLIIGELIEGMSVQLRFQLRDGACGCEDVVVMAEVALAVTIRKIVFAEFGCNPLVGRLPI